MIYRLFLITCFIVICNTSNLSASSTIFNSDPIANFVVNRNDFLQNDMSDQIIGTWVSQKGDGQVQIYKRDKLYFGKIVYIRRKNADGSPIVDVHNPDLVKQKQTLMDLEILKNFTYSGENIWEDGTIYDPKSGNTYSCKMTLSSHDVLRIRGFIGISLLGRTEIWSRAVK